MSSRNTFQENWITLRDVPAMVSFCQRRKKSLMMLGGAGLGKSQIIKTIANSMFGERPDNVVDLRLADKDPTDVIGVQIPVQCDDGITRSVYAIPDFWPQDPNWEGIIFLDEMLHADSYMQKVAFQIMLDRRIGAYIFPEKAILVGAGNRSGDGTSVTPMEAPLANRMVIVELMYDTQIFIEDFAMHNDVHPSVIGYLGSNPGDIENFEAMYEEGCPSYATPRSWVTTSDAVHDYDAGLISARHAKVIIQGVIGTILMKQFWTYHTRIRVMTPIQHIMDGSVKQHTGPDSADVLWMIGSQGAIWLRKAMKDTSITDDEVIEYAGNFLQYMHSNFNDMNKDFVSSVFMSFIQENAFGKAILMDGKREKLPAKLLSKNKVVMEIIGEYRENYAEAVKEISQ